MCDLQACALGTWGSRHPVTEEEIRAVAWQRALAFYPEGPQDQISSSAIEELHALSRKLGASRESGAQQTRPIIGSESIGRSLAEKRARSTPYADRSDLPDRGGGGWCRDRAHGLVHR